MFLQEDKFPQLITWHWRTNITKKNQPDKASSAEAVIPDLIPMSTQDMNNIKRWQWMLLVITVIVERERSFIPIPEMIKNRKDQQVLKVNWEARSLDSKVMTIPKVFLASKIFKDLMRTIPRWSKVDHKLDLKWKASQDLSSIAFSEKKELKQIKKAKKDLLFLRKIAFFRRLHIWGKSKKWPNNSQKKQLRLRTLMMFK